MSRSENQVVEQIFRAEYGKVLAIITKHLGTSYFQLAEDIVQDTLISAMTNWSVNGIPKNKTAWLVQVAKRKAINEIKRRQMMQKHHQGDFFNDNVESTGKDVFLDNEIEDSQLRMIFTCCHPNLNLESQITLTLKTLCGFGAKEIARSLLTNESTVSKRLYRAKSALRDLSFQVPQGNELNERLEAVALTLYLLFNQGYNSSSLDKLIQKDLCLEAIRLCKLVTSKFPDAKEVKALLALMCLHTARFEARLDHNGALILFQDQNRNKWNHEMINIGMQYFQQSLHGEALSAYHIEARIAAEHCLSISFENTNWELIYEQYQLLLELKPNPIIQLNLAIIQSKTEGYQASLKSLKDLEKSDILSDYYLLPATIGIFSMEISNHQQALLYLEETLKLKPSEIESEYLNGKIEICKNLLSKS